LFKSERLKDNCTASHRTSRFTPEFSISISKSQQTATEATIFAFVHKRVAKVHLPRPRLLVSMVWRVTKQKDNSSRVFLSQTV